MQIWNVMKSNRDEQINHSLREHQANIGEWQHSSTVKDLHVWTDRLIVEFKLETLLSVLNIEKLRGSARGHFRYNRNGFGLRNEITIDKDYAHSSEYWRVLGTLLHQLIHAEQQATGTDSESSKHRNYHNTAFIERAKTFGLIVDRRGRQQYATPPTRFSELLKQHGVEMPAGGDDEQEGQDDDHEPSGGSKLKLWMCSCKPKPVRVRVAIQDFQARCLKCGQIFVREDMVNSKTHQQHGD
jgi:hypothetical protein